MLILDEATSSLDTKASGWSKTPWSVSGGTDNADHCPPAQHCPPADRLVVLDHGRTSRKAPTRISWPRVAFCPLYQQQFRTIRRCRSAERSVPSPDQRPHLSGGR